MGTDYRASVDETSDYFKFFYSMRTEYKVIIQDSKI